jgi:hypothetical protein
MTAGKTDVGAFEAIPSGMAGYWLVRPKGAVGTCGSYPRPWAAVYVRADASEVAIRIAVNSGLCTANVESTTGGNWGV